MHIAPTEVKPRIVGFRIDRPDRTVVQEREQRLSNSMTVLWQRGRCLLENRGKNVDQLHRYVDRPSRLPRLREFHDQGNLKRFTIEKNPVLLLAMLIEAFAMIGEEQDERLVIDAFSLQITDEISDDCVRGGNLAVVMIRVPAEVRLGRSIGGGRLIQGQEKKEWWANFAVEAS